MKYLFLLPLTLFAYSFNPFFVSMGGTYSHIDTRFYFSDDQFSTARSIDEHLKDQNAGALNARIQYFSQNRPFVRASYTYGVPDSSDSYTQMTVRAQNNTGTISQDFSSNISYKLEGHYFGFTGSLGYPFRIGPLQLIPLAGVDYGKDNLKRENIQKPTLSSTSGVHTLTATFGPEPIIKSRTLLGVVGLNLFCASSPYSFIRWEAGYHFKYGKNITKTSYSNHSVVVDNDLMVTTVRSFSKNMSEKHFSWAHAFYVGGNFGLPYHLVLSPFFSYEYLRVESKAGGATQKEVGSQDVISGGDTTTTPINTYKKLGFGGIKRQIFCATLLLSYTF